MPAMIKNISIYIPLFLGLYCLAFLERLHDALDDAYASEHQNDEEKHDPQ